MTAVALLTTAVVVRWPAWTRHVGRSGTAGPARPSGPAGASSGNTGGGTPTPTSSTAAASRTATVPAGGGTPAGNGPAPGTAVAQPTCVLPEIRCIPSPATVGNATRDYSPVKDNGADLTAEFGNGPDCTRGNRPVCLKLNWKTYGRGDLASATYGMIFDPPLDLSQYRSITLWMRLPNGVGEYFQVFLEDPSHVIRMAAVRQTDQKPTTEWQPLPIPFDAFSATGTGAFDWHRVAQMRFTWNSASHDNGLYINEIACTR